jgi:uncharacterized protein
MARITWTTLLLSGLVTIARLDCEAERSAQELVEAARLGDRVTVNDLLEKGYFVDERDKDDRTALMVASGHGYYEISEVLIRAGADVNARDRDGLTPLIAAATGGSVQASELLLSHGAKPDAVMNTGVSALMMAAGLGHREVVEHLLDANAPTEKRVT